VSISVHEDTLRKHLRAAKLAGSPFFLPVRRASARHTGRKKGDCFGPETQGGARSSLALGFVAESLRDSDWGGCSDGLGEARWGGALGEGMAIWSTELLGVIKVFESAAFEFVFDQVG
jgi:hypothetical protein